MTQPNNQPDPASAPNLDELLGTQGPNRTRISKGDSTDQLSRLVDKAGVADQYLLSDRYVVQQNQPLGRGGMGEVYLATDTKVGNRQVAIKFLHSDQATSRDIFARFIAEMNIAGALNHPNIVHVYDSNPSAELPYLVMEYVDGGNLLSHCHGKLSKEEVLAIGKQLCKALMAAHQAGIIHRDIKPANILINRQGIPKLTDFGLSKHTSQPQHSLTGAQMGTPYYMSPEQLRDSKSVDARSDLYSLGVTLYHLATGDHPQTIRLDVLPTVLRTILERALQKDPADRFNSASEMLMAIEASLSSRGSDVAKPRAGGLKRGECYFCGEINSESRKHCGNCAQKLTVLCLNCRVSIPIWERVCDDCGSLQQPLLDNRFEKLESVRVQAETDLQERNFSAANKLLADSATLFDDPRCSEALSWREEFKRRLEATELEVQQQLEEMENKKKQEAIELEGRTNQRKRDEEGSQPLSTTAFDFSQPSTAAEQSKSESTSVVVERKTWLLRRVLLSLLVASVALLGIAYLVSNTAESFRLANEEKTRDEFQHTYPRLTNSIGMTFQQLPAGTFLMGSDDSEVGNLINDESRHQVSLSRPFYIGLYEVTEGEYEQVMGTRPDSAQGKNYPVKKVSWENASDFIRRLNELPAEKAAGRLYRLPTEAEWEYACRAGSQTAYCFGDSMDGLSNYAWYTLNSEREAQEVGQKRPNVWGLYDMHGNVWEWCSDWYGEYPTASANDPIGPISGTTRVYRGGSWSDMAGGCRSANRNDLAPTYENFNLGFRLVCSVNEEADR